MYLQSHFSAENDWRNSSAFRWRVEQTLATGLCVFVMTSKEYSYFCSRDHFDICRPACFFTLSQYFTITAFVNRLLIINICTSERFSAGTALVKVLYFHQWTYNVFCSTYLSFSFIKSTEVKLEFWSSFYCLERSHHSRNTMPNCRLICFIVFSSVIFHQVHLFALHWSAINSLIFPLILILSRWVNRWLHCWDVKFEFNSIVPFILIRLNTWLGRDTYIVRFIPFQNPCFSQLNICPNRYGHCQVEIRSPGCQWICLFLCCGWYKVMCKSLFVSISLDYVSECVVLSLWYFWVKMFQLNQLVFVFASVSINHNIYLRCCYCEGGINKTNWLLSRVISIAALNIYLLGFSRWSKSCILGQKLLAYRCLYCFISLMWAWHSGDMIPKNWKRNSGSFSGLVVLLFKNCARKLLFLRKMQLFANSVTQWLNGNQDLKPFRRKRVAPR